MRGNRWRRLDSVLSFIGRVVGTRRGNKVATTVLAVGGALAAVLIHNAKLGTEIFLLVTFLESGTFTLIYGIAGSWKESEAARAVFWVVGAYALISGHILSTGWLHWTYWWTQDLRQLLYLGLAVGGLNLLLTMTRLLRS